MVVLQPGIGSVADSTKEWNSHTDGSRMTTGKMSSFEKSFVNSDRHSWQVSQNAERLVRFTNPQPGQRYLDVGCGNGTATAYIGRRFRLEVTGVDIDAEQITLAKANSRKMTNVCFTTLDSRDLTFADGEFEIVFTNKVIHHIPNWQKSVAEMIRVLSSGGYLVYSDFIFPPLVARLGEAFFSNQGGFPTRRALEDLFMRSGLQVVHRFVPPLHFEGIYLKK